MAMRVNELDTVKIKAIADSKLMSYSDLANASGISYQTAAKLLRPNNKRPAAYNTIKKIAAALDVQPTEIIL